MAGYTIGKIIMDIKVKLRINTHRAIIPMANISNIPVIITTFWNDNPTIKCRK